jgi:N-acetylglutamate synthase-like GNAT family acetyltransferase
MISLRKVKISDSKHLTALSNQLGYSTNENLIRERILNIIERHDHCIYIAQKNNEIVAWIHAFVALRIESDAFVEIGGLVVSEVHRKQGVGKALIDEVVKWAKEKDIPKVRVRCNTIREGAHTFYEKIGFEEVKEQKVFDFDINPSHE